MELLHHHLLEAKEEWSEKDIIAMTRGRATRTPARFGLRKMCVDLAVQARSRTSLSCAESMLMFLHT